MDEKTSNTASNIGTSKQFRASVANSGSSSCLCGQGKTATIIMEGSGGSKENISVNVHPTTGGQFELRINLNESIETLKKLISRKLKVPKERICLLYRDKHLKDGTLGENELIDGCRVILLPSVESGLLAQRPEQSVMQALENLNDSQVTDFLSGKAPLNLTMRLGDHMMLIQLQLSTVAPNQSRKSSGSSSSPKTVSSSTNSSPASSPPNSRPSNPKGANTPLTSPWLTKSHTSPTLSACDAQGHKPQCCEHKPCSNECADNVRTLLDTKALAEASRNLTQTLKQLSSEVLTGKHGDTDNGCEVRLDTTKQKTVTSRTQTVVTDFSNSKESTSKLKQGAIIESMHHHGKGVYSGTFSGTLNPALQDKHGRPKRDISTIIHILNDLLCATPQYRQQSASSSSQSRPTTPPQSCSPDVSLSDDSWRIDQENQATRGKMEQLRLIMSERQARRRARRQQRQPYTWSAKSETSVKTEADDRGREEASSQGFELNPEPMVA